MRNGFDRSPSVIRRWGSLLAAYHTTSPLATLVKLGVLYVKKNQSIFWSIEATLCGLDCSMFLENASLYEGNNAGYESNRPRKMWSRLDQ
ncbi:uncharacterized protein ANIA_11601 [Aspergillus nidulans FGSC A4]|uniref:Uncharacterized protein n=1 Tax=Emericella nidulans (strain FGSC A4 / ATCC 38163 / CBS 112.46 / NRRL 194 / M139) TaxID=227321 RepID=C8VE29_EMENI|nr:hypothetical protein [Aspergillus nidulans FGSC A4]CBF80335.1 TPA: hypothetical protein ANIA_11601 [Aspergillus nidulans FGSC A4]